MLNFIEMHIHTPHTHNCVMAIILVKLCFCQQPSLRTEGLRWSNVLLPTCHHHTDGNQHIWTSENMLRILNSVTYTITSSSHRNSVSLKSIYMSCMNELISYFKIAISHTQIMCYPLQYSL